MLQSKRVLAGLLTLFIAVGGCAAANEQPAAQQAAESAGGQASGKLSFYTSQPEEDATKLVEAFNKKHPDVQVATFRSGTEEVIAKVLAEKEAGGVQADVLLVADAVTFEGLKKQDLLLSYKSPELDKIPESMVDPDGMYSGTKVISTALAVNTEKVKSMPDSWSVLASAENKDAGIMPSPLYSGAAAYNVGVFTRTDGFGWDFLDGMKANNMSVVKGNGAVMKAVASGEKSYGMVVDFMVVREKAKGSPVELVYPSEGVPVITEPVGIMKDAKNMEAAKAFVDFVLSEEGQKVAAEIGYTPVREGVQAPEGLKNVSELKVLSSDISVLTEAREEDKKQFTALFGQ
ncbi:ABC transporter substrate-binding protein [Paenibacillus alkalitolerans]|uniref:ABC transporter substrate-binding protein n=1 Tax=Paenibacillus alkalitolerans TaxID=2799335 RepID=UPI0018F3788D|nr:ABC transporter substrate-binding protein [Paenibacillus alkalitolerans]